MLKILVTGSSGQVGSELRVLAPSYKNFEFTFIDSKILDLNVKNAILDYFSHKSFDVIINCASYTAVDKAESEVALAEAINHHAVSELAQIAKNKKISLVHLSTDYVFNGKNTRPYLENDPTDPINVYGATKCSGEKAILSIAPEKSIIIRTSWVYSSFGNNFVKTMLRLGRERKSLGVINDQVGTPTYARDLASTILNIIPQIKNSIPEIYHYTNEGEASWYDFAKLIFDISGITCQVNPITTAQYPTPAKRPGYSLLNKSKIKNDFDITIPDWKSSLKVCLETNKLF